MDPAQQPGQLLFAGFEGTRVPEDLGALISDGRVGGAVIFERNVESPSQLRALVDDLHARAPAEAPLTVAIDQEGGRVQRCRAPWTEWPPMRALGERGTPDDTRAVARALGRELADLRVDLDFAPCVDVDGGPGEAVIGDRSFSPSPDAVARHAAAFVEALQSAGLSAKDSLVDEGNWTAISGEHCLAQLLTRHPEIDGVFVCNDSMALGAAKAARERGLRIPQDLAIVGFDDMPDAAYFCPALSTVRQDMVELGCRAVRELREVIEANRSGTTFTPKNVVLQPELIVRESSVRTGS